MVEKALVETQSIPDLTVREPSGVVTLDHGVLNDMAADRLGSMSPHWRATRSGMLTTTSMKTILPQEAFIPE
jgi:hypothetical protein